METKMGKCELCGAIYFLSYGICSNSGNCLHGMLHEIPSRESALIWWNKLSLDDKNFFINKCHFLRNSDSLTGREIENLYKINVYIESIKIKTFIDESTNLNIMEIDKFVPNFTTPEEKRQLVLEFFHNQQQVKLVTINKLILEISNEDKLKVLQMICEQLAMFYPQRDIQPIIDKEFH